MDYKEKFEDFFSKMQGLLENAERQGHIVIRVEDLENAFPELCESEDEKIRKEIIRYLKRRLEISSSIPAAIGSWIAWLEKQGEQKPQRMISAEAKEAMYDKPACAWSEKDEKEYKYVLKFVDNILNNCGNKKDYEHCKRCYDWLKSLKQRIGG